MRPVRALYIKEFAAGQQRPDEAEETASVFFVYHQLYHRAMPAYMYHHYDNQALHPLQRTISSHPVTLHCVSVI